MHSLNLSPVVPPGPNGLIWRAVQQWRYGVQKKNVSWGKDGAEDETRTRDILLGKEAFYH